MVRIRKDYTPEEVEYLHSEPTHEIWHHICDLIKKHDSRSILDIGCATGAVNLFLNDYIYWYHGIDASESLIQEGKRFWNDNPNISFHCAEWEDVSDNITCDCMLLLGVLPYGEPKWCDTPYKNAFEMYQKMVEKFKPRQVIIRETDQLLDGEQILDLTPFLNIASSMERFRVDTQLGRKIVLNVITSS